MKKQQRQFTNVPVIMAATGAVGTIDTSTLPEKDWRVHSGPAPVANEDVHSLKSQKIAGTRNTVIRAKSGKELCVTDGEAERFSSDLLTELGYKVIAPAQA